MKELKNESAQAILENTGLADETAGETAAEQGSKNLSVEEAFEKLDGMIEVLSDRETPLEKAFETYQEAVKLLKACSGQIDLVEKKVMMLNEEGGLDEL
jgi:exodeoxyribonuclease VII small subunit